MSVQCKNCYFCLGIATKDAECFARVYQIRKVNPNKQRPCKDFISKSSIKNFIDIEDR